MTVTTYVSKVACINWTLNLEAQISLCLALPLLVSQIIEVFVFPIGYNGEFQKFVKIRNSKKIQKNKKKKQNSTFVTLTEKKIQKDENE